MSNKSKKLTSRNVNDPAPSTTKKMSQVRRRRLFGDLQEKLTASYEEIREDLAQMRNQILRQLDRLLEAAEYLEEEPADALQMTEEITQHLTHPTSMLLLRMADSLQSEDEPLLDKNRSKTLDHVLRQQGVCTVQKKNPTTRRTDHSSTLKAPQENPVITPTISNAMDSGLGHSRGVMSNELSFPIYHKDELQDLPQVPVSMLNSTQTNQKITVKDKKGSASSIDQIEKKEIIKEIPKETTKETQKSQSQIEMFEDYDPFAISGVYETEHHNERETDEIKNVSQNSRKSEPIKHLNNASVNELKKVTDELSESEKDTPINEIEEEHDRKKINTINKSKIEKSEILNKTVQRERRTSKRKSSLKKSIVETEECKENVSPQISKTSENELSADEQECVATVPNIKITSPSRDIMPVASEQNLSNEQSLLSSKEQPKLMQNQSIRRSGRKQRRLKAVCTVKRSAYARIIARVSSTQRKRRPKELEEIKRFNPAKGRELLAKQKEDLMCKSEIENKCEQKSSQPAMTPKRREVSICEPTTRVFEPLGMFGNRRDVSYVIDRLESIKRTCAQHYAMVLNSLPDEVLQMSASAILLKPLSEYEDPLFEINKHLNKLHKNFNRY